jgi:TolB-like protein
MYAVAAFALLQFADLLVPTLFSERTYTILVVLTICAFPVALVTAWAFEITPQGIKRDHTLAETAGYSRRSVTTFARFALVVLVIGASASAGWVVWRRSQSRLVAEPADASARLFASDLDPRRIAVLYFDDHSPARNLGYLADGLTEELIHRLAAVDTLDVISRNGVRPVREGRLTIDSLVRALGVGTYVEGSVTRSGERLRVRAQLVDAAAGSQLSSHSFDRPLGELFALQDSLADEVAASLRLRLGVEVTAKRERDQSNSVEAWTLVRRAEQISSDVQDLWDSDAAAAARGLDRADSLLARAETLDPGWPGPILYRGWLARTRAGYASVIPGVFAEEPLRDALGHADRALALAPENAEALDLRGTARYELWDATAAEGPAAEQLLDLAEADLRAATERDPSRAQAWWTLSEVLRQRTRFEESRRFAARALDEDAFLETASDIINQLFHTSFELEDHSEAQRWCAEGKRRFPNYVDFRICELLILATVDDMEPDIERARGVADTLVVVRAEQDRPVFRAYADMQIAKLFARSGERDSAQVLIQRAHGDEFQLWLAYDEAHARLLLGEQDEALELLKRYAEINPQRRSYWPRDWWLRGLWDHPGFQELVGESAKPQP